MKKISRVIFFLIFTNSLFARNLFTIDENDGKLVEVQLVGNKYVISSNPLKEIEKSKILVISKFDDTNVVLGKMLKQWIILLLLA